MSVTRICTIVWIILLVLTIISGFLADGTIELAPTAVTLIIFVIAFLKVRMVIIHFMEIGHAALPLRIILELWALATFAALIFLYFMPPTLAE